MNSSAPESVRTHIADTAKNGLDDAKMTTAFHACYERFADHL